MKRSILFVVIFSLTIGISILHSQIAYYNAITLRKFFLYDSIAKTWGSDNDSIIYIFKKYSLDKTSLEETKNAYNANPFFKDLRYNGTIRSLDKSHEIANSTVAYLQGLDVSTVADGVAKFLVKRTKQELNMMFFDRFKKAIASEEYSDMQTLFPETYQTLVALGDDIYLFEQYLDVLRSSFKTDLDNLPSHFPSLIKNHEKFFNTYPDLKATIETAFYVANGLKDNKHPGDILAGYDVSMLDLVTDKNWKGAMQTLQLFSNSLRDTSANRYWVSKDDVYKLVKDETTLKIYLGLIYQQAKNQSISFESNITLVQVLDTIAAIEKKNNYQSAKKYLQLFVVQTKKIEDILQQFKTIPKASLTYKQYYTFASTSIDFLEYASNAVDLIPAEKRNDFKKVLSLRNSLKRYISYTRTASNMVLDVSQKKYSLAIINAVHFYDSTIALHSSSSIDSLEGYIDTYTCNYKKNLDTLEKKKKEFATLTADSLKAAINRDIEKLKTAIDEYCAKEKELTIQKATFDIPKKLLKYGTFIATIAQAESSEQVEAAIEAFALPPGSSRTKRTNCFNVSVNSYVGLFWGYEQIDGLDAPVKELKDLKFNATGVTAPIGIAFNFGAPEWLGSTSLFISAIDLGAITAYRFRNDSTETTPTIKLKDILSPGAFLSLGIKGTPISINLGAQIGPLLREVTATQATHGNSYVRYSLSLNVDIPLLDIYTKPKN